MMRHYHFLFSGQGREFLVEQYLEKKLSTRRIAKMCRTYGNLVLRAMQWHSIPVRNKSEATRNFFENKKDKSCS